MTRRISFLRPTTGSISPLRASSVRSRPNALRAGVLTSFFSSDRPPGRCGAAGRGLLAAALASAGELGIELAQDLVAGALDVDVERLEHARGHALALAQQAEQDVLGADVGMVERLRLLAGQREHLLHARRVGDVARALVSWPVPTCFSTAARTVSRSSPIFWSTLTATPWPSLIRPEQDVLRADVVVVEAVGFLAGQRQHLLGARREIVHRFL